MDTITGPRELGMLFRGCILRVPPYQRAYAWSPDPPLQNFWIFSAISVITRLIRKRTTSMAPYSSTGCAMSDMGV